MDKSDDKKIERRGGARPNTGGKREGSGRPRILEGDYIRSPYSIARENDAQLIRWAERGFKCKSEYLNHLLSKALQHLED